MKRLIEICALCALMLAGARLQAMPIGIRTLMHGHAVARQVAELPSVQTWTVTFDAQGGVIDGESTATAIVTNGCAIGTLPTATKPDYTFLGWFTAETDGDRVTTETEIFADVTFHAHWLCKFSQGEDDDWTQLADGSWQSGATADGATNSICMMVNSAGVVSFRWKTSCEDYFNFKGMLLRQDGLSFFVDGEERAFANGEMSDWSAQSIEIEGAGAHTLSWAYIKDVSGEDGEDCAWICDVVWTPAESGGVTVDVGDGAIVTVSNSWLAENTTRAATDDAANGRKVWECYVLGLDPEDADDDFRITKFWMDGTIPMFEVNHTKDGDGNSFVPRMRKLGKAKLTDKWSPVPEGGEDSFRFFTVEVTIE